MEKGACQALAVLEQRTYKMCFELAPFQSSFDSSVGRAVDCSRYCNAEIHRSLVQIRLEGDFFFQWKLGLQIVIWAF